MSLLSIIIIGILSFALILIWHHSQKIQQQLQQQQKHHQQQQQLLDYLHALINNIPDLTWMKDKNSQYLLANKALSHFFGLSQEDIIGKKDSEICINKTQAQAFLKDDLTILKKKQIILCEEEISGADGFTLWSETIKVPVYDKQNNFVGTAGIARDITKRKIVEDKMKHLAYHDHLTGMPNKAYFLKHLSALLADQSNPIAVLLLDLNDFKTINDSLGHAYGDLVLIQIAKRLESLVDQYTTVARFGGDEFLISHRCEQANSFEKLKKKLSEQFTSPITINEINYSFTASSGVAFSPNDGIDCETLLKHADLAMYQSKTNHHNECVIFLPEFAKKSIYRMQLSNQLSEAIYNDELNLVYQPKVNSIDDSMVGIEALLRWTDKSGNTIPPDDFIPIAEQNGTINEIGEWVIKAALKQVRTWLDKQLPLVPISINITANQLKQRYFVDFLLQQLEHYQIPGNLIELELTESVLMENIENTIPLLNEMRKKGIMFSIDDFGTGYSSLSYLSSLPIDVLKIDKSFITDLHLHSNNQKIVKTIVQLANNFNLSLIAEGVQSKKELVETNLCGISIIQGYYFSYPLTAKELERKWLNCNQPKNETLTFEMKQN
ncbi:MAG: EAL domain-containing protein [Psychromonas sp.]